MTLDIDKINNHKKSPRDPKVRGTIVAIVEYT